MLSHTAKDHRHAHHHAVPGYILIDEIVVALDNEDVTRNKVTARLGKLVKAGRIAKETVKVDGNKRMAYRLADAINEDAE